MGRPRTAGMFVGLLALPAAAARSAARAVWRGTLSDGLPFVQDDATGSGARPAAAPPGRQGEDHGRRPGSSSARASSAPIALTFQNPNKHKVTDEARPGQDRQDHRAPRGRRPPVHHGGLRDPADAAPDPAGCRPSGPPTWPPCGVPMDTWPSLTMRNRPLNQDGCKGAELKLRFKARGLRGDDRGDDELRGAGAGRSRSCSPSVSRCWWPGSPRRTGAPRAAGPPPRPRAAPRP